MTIKPVEVLALTLLDGKERRFLLTAGGGQRLKARFGVKIITDILQRDAYEVGPPLLFEAMLDKGEMTEEQFLELLPGGLEFLSRAITGVFGVSVPDDKERPTSASETPTIQ